MIELKFDYHVHKAVEGLRDCCDNNYHECDNCVFGEHNECDLTKRPCNKILRIV